MKMKKLFDFLAAAAVASVMAVSASITAFADDEKLSDVEIDVSSAVVAKAWAQSLKVDSTVFDASRMTEDSVVKITYTCDKAVEDAGTDYPVELVVQSWENPDTPMVDAQGGVWAKVAPAKYDDKSATYRYSDIVKAYGTDDLKEVNCMLVGATDKAEITCTGMTVTNCKEKGNHVYPEEEKEGVNPVFIIIGVVAGIIIAVVVIVVIMNKKSSEAFDVASGKFVDKKDLDQ